MAVRNGGRRAELEPHHGQLAALFDMTLSCTCVREPVAATIAPMHGHRRELPCATSSMLPGLLARNQVSIKCLDMKLGEAAY